MASGKVSEYTLRAGCTVQGAKLEIADLFVINGQKMRCQRKIYIMGQTSKEIAM